MSKNICKTVIGAALGVALCFSSTGAIAGAVPATSSFAPMSISPFVALSAYGTIQSRSAICAATVGAAGVSAAAEGQPAAGCVLPVLDPVAPAVIEAAPGAVYVPPPAGFGFGIGALLAGLVAVAGLAAVLLSNGDNDDRLPLSPD